MIRAIIIDDELGSIRALKWELQGINAPIQIIDEIQDPFRAEERIKTLKPDLVFLDIEMPGKSGFELLEDIGEIFFELIFITAFDEFALKAFEVSAIDYLLKPVDEDSLDKAIRKITDRREQGLMSRKLETLFENLRKDDSTFQTIALPNADGLDFIEIRDIVRCEADSNYTHVYLTNEKLLISRTLKDIEKLLPAEQFFRVHQSHLINLRHIRKYVRGKTGYILLKDGTSIPVSRDRKMDFLKQFSA
ncbi:MAG: response regulator [Bacteroidetes bacterium]|nr:response regulator [Bacteroidota bacterium]